MDIGGKSYTINYWQNETQVSIIQYQILEDSASGSWGQALAVVGVLALAASCYYFPAAVTGIIAIGEMMGRDFVR